MELMEFYKKIKNPIDDPAVIDKLIYAYSEQSKGLGGFYGQLTKTVKKERIYGPTYEEDADLFYSRMFNKWKNSIVSLTREQFIDLYNKGSYGKDFIKMREFLKSVPDVKTKKEADDIFFGNYNDKELKKALDKYRWTALGDVSMWTHVSSRYLTAKQDKQQNVEHRLYFDTEPIDTYKMAMYLVEKCDKYHIPFYFKFDDIGNRDDTIVLYSSTENLMKYVDILIEIKKEHPDLIARVKEPPVLTGKIDGWIGYGSEPSRTPDGKAQSFNEVRSKAIETAIDKVNKKWIIDHKNMIITYKGKNISFQNYIALEATRKILETLKKRFIYYEEYEMNMAKSKNISYDPNKVINKLGFSLQDLNSTSFEAKLYRTIQSKIEISLTNFCNGKNVESIIMNIRNGKEINFSCYDLKDLIDSLSYSISKNDSNFSKDVHTEIIANAKQYGIDVDKFCFDIRSKKRMELVQAQKNKEELLELQKQSSSGNQSFGGKK